MNGVYFARSRQNTSVCSIKVWRLNSLTGKVESEWLTYAGIVLEKSTAYAVTILEHALKHISLVDCTGIVIWSDKGGSFKSYEMLGTCAGKVMADICKDCEIDYGESQEFKNDCDQYFGNLRSNSFGVCSLVWEGDRRVHSATLQFGKLHGVASLLPLAC